MTKCKISSGVTQILTIFSADRFFSGIFRTLKSQKLMVFLIFAHAILTGVLLEKPHFSLKIVTF